MSVHDAEVSIALLVINELIATRASSSYEQVLTLNSHLRLKIVFRSRPLSLILRIVPACNVVCCLTLVWFASVFVSVCINIDFCNSSVILNLDTIFYECWSSLILKSLTFSEMSTTRRTRLRRLVLFT